MYFCLVESTSTHLKHWSKSCASSTASSASSVIVSTIMPVADNPLDVLGVIREIRNKELVFRSFDPSCDPNLYKSLFSSYCYGCDKRIYYHLLDGPCLYDSDEQHGLCDNY